MKQFMYAITPAHTRPGPLPIECAFAFVCYCPMPSVFEKYIIQKSEIRYFVHSHPLFVVFCEYEGYKFVVIAEVYGGPVSSATIEELNGYGLKKIYGIGYVGYLGDVIIEDQPPRQLKIGQNIRAASSLAELGTTPHYEGKLDDEYIVTNDTYHHIDGIVDVCIWTTNCMYRETQREVDRVKDLGCEVVNMDTSHFIAACEDMHITCNYFATISDIVKFNNDGWEDGLSAALSDSKSIVRRSQDELIESILLNEVPTLKTYIERLEKILLSTSVCTSHDANHAIAVMNNAQKAIKEYSLSSNIQEAIILAALLHDIDDKKFFPYNTNLDNMRYILSNKSPEFKQLVAEMINLVSSSVNGDMVPDEKEEWKLIPRYADRLEAMGKVGIQRCYEYSKTIGNPLITENTPLVKDRDELWKVASLERYSQYKGKSLSFLDHFYDKLLRLGGFSIQNKWLLEQAEKQTQITAQFVLDFCAAEDKDAFVKTYLTK